MLLVDQARISTDPTETGKPRVTAFEHRSSIDANPGLKFVPRLRLQAFDNVPYWPLGLAQLPTAFQQDITGVPEGFVIFWNVRRT